MSAWRNRGDSRCASPGSRAGKKVTWPGNCWDCCASRGKTVTIFCDCTADLLTSPQAVIWNFQAEFEKTQELWKPGCCSGSRMPYCSICDRPTKKTDWPLTAHCWISPAFQSSPWCFLCCLKLKGCFCVLLLAESGVSSPHRVREIIGTYLSKRWQCCQNGGTPPHLWLVTSDNLHHYIPHWTASSCPWIIPKKDPVNKSSFSKSFYMEKFSTSNLIQSLLAR